MKVLFFVEPHGIRDGFSEYEAPLRRMLPVLAEVAVRPGWDARLLCNSLMADLVLREAPELWPLVLIPTPAERQRMLELSVAWDAEGVRRWRALMRDPEAQVTRFYTCLLERLHTEDFAFEAIVLWGENEAVRQVSEAKGLVRAHLELASFRAPFTSALLIDPKGVNGAASTATLDLSALVHEPPDVGTLLQSVYPNDDPRITAPARGVPTALVPLQLSDDANIMLYSRYDTPADFLEDILPPLLKAGFTVQLKPHPGAAVRGGEVWAAQERALAPWLGRAGIEILPESEPPEALPARLAAADLVVALNSSVLFESTLLGGIAVPMGEACFAPPGAHPTFAAAIDQHADPDWREVWQARARCVAAALLSAAFVRDIDLVPALIRRLELWRDADARDPHASLAALERPRS